MQELSAVFRISITKIGDMTSNNVYDNQPDRYNCLFSVSIIILFRGYSNQFAACMANHNCTH